ncbi:hypothetical protein PZA11_000944 [Diplocarpon coronariae]|uniref:Ribosomal protein S n=1 Tax=Diplocarpon coronariae TaxID=2795749 RepID=A0A218ZC79_9HELO|nr:hypothetical protein JHW43_007392 [Diplocarpon mali]OWP05608.1 ribosomal protein S [Marssonina coronariae]
MPPRIPVPTNVGVTNLCFRPSLNTQLSVVTPASYTTMAQRRKHKDPYALAQSKQRKDSNLSRQAVLRKERKAAMGDPVRGITTPFLESFDDVGGSVAFKKTAAIDVQGSEIKSVDNVLLNHFLIPSELEASLKHSQALTEPIVSTIRDFADPVKEEEAKQRHQDGHANAVAALARIVSLSNANQKDKTRANVLRCIEKFGRHNTDQTLRPRAPPNPETLGSKPQAEKTPRAGPDTGSSEVQIAILTAKIRVLANQLERGGKKDKINKRNLRIMVHKRQKLLRYLRTKERGGDRWQHLVDSLGLTEGTWQGEISL